MSDPDANHAREALADARAPRRAGHLPHRDRAISPTSSCRRARSRRRPAPSPTPTAWCSSAARRSSRRATRARTSGSSSEIARRLGLDWHDGSPRRGVRRDAPGDADHRRHHLGAARARARGDLSVRAGRRPGESVVFTESFPRETGRARFVPADIIPADERPDAEYPMVLITGRQLEHWHTGSMTRRAAVLDAIEPDPVALDPSARPRRARRGAGRRRHDRVAARQGLALRARRRRLAARRGVRAVLLLRGGDNRLTNAGARPVREDPRVQVLRGAPVARRPVEEQDELRRRPASRRSG